MDLITCMQHFISVVDHQGFMKAARHCHTSVATISKHVNYLESWYGKCLLHRTTRTVKLTPVGERFYQEAKLIVEKLSALKVSHAHNEPPQGLIRLNIPSTFNEGLLLEPIFKFLQKNPKISLNIVSKPYLEELTNNTADIVITLKKPHSVDIKSFKLLEIKRGLFVAPAYLKKFGSIKRIENLSNHNCLIFTDKYMPNVWNFLQNKKINVHGPLMADHFSLLIKAALEGVGVLNIAENFIETELKAGKLVPILTKYRVIEAELYVYYLRYRSTSAMQYFLEYLQQYFKISK